MPTPEPPGDLGAEGQRIWKQGTKEKQFDEVQDLEMLRMLGKCGDEMAEFEATLKREGRFIEDRWHQRREHPAGRALRETRTLFLKLVRELGLNIAIPESRPRRQY